MWNLIDNDELMYLWHKIIATSKGSHVNSLYLRMFNLRCHQFHSQNDRKMNFVHFFELVILVCKWHELEKSNDRCELKSENGGVIETNKGVEVRLKRR